jgi:signal recognition particle receptor subunit beta
MVQFNFSERTIKAKVVYYGPAQSGKTTNLEQIHRLTDPEGNNRLISLNTAQDRTLFFDLLPFSLGAVSGYDFKIQLYTVPGQVQYNATRRVVLAGADAVVFVADSQKSALKENQSAFENMKVNLLANRLVPEKVPLVIQYNKQDLPNVQTEADLNRALNLWGRKAFPAVAARGQGVLETFVAVVQEMLAAIAVKYNLKEKGLDPASVPDVVAQAFAAVLSKAVPTSPASASPPPPARVILRAGDSGQFPAIQPSADSGLVSEELLHRSIRSNVDLAEALANVVREMNIGLGSILSHAHLVLSSPEEAKRTTAVSNIQRETARLRQIVQELGRAGALAPSDEPPAPTPAPPAVVPRPEVSALAPSVPAPAVATTVAPAPASAPASAPTPPAEAAPPSPPASGFLPMIQEAMTAARAILDARGISVDVRIPPNTPAPRCAPAVLKRAATALLNGLAAVSAPGSAIVLRSEKKPVLLRSKDGEVKRDFLMLALGHGGTLTAEEQQRILQGASPGPLGDAHRLVREMGGFVRFAPLPGGALETRVFLPAA